MATKKSSGIRVRFRNRFFNPIFFHLQKYIQDDSIRNIISFGGSSAGKSHEHVHLLCLDGYMRGYNSVVFRKEQSSVKDTIRNDFDEVVSKVVDNPELEGMFEMQEFKVLMDTGNFIRLRGLDKPDKVKGLKGFRVVYLDEGDQFFQSDLSELQRRLRGEDGQKIMMSLNPVDEGHYINKDIIQKDEWSLLPNHVKNNPYSYLSDDSYVKINKKGNTVIIKTNHKDNKWIVGGEVVVNGKTIKYGRVDKHVLDHFEDLMVKNPNDYQVYALGNWGRISNDNPFFYYVRQESIAKPLDILDEEPILFSFDFNIDSCACTVLQIDNESGLYVLGCHTVYGGVRELCKELRRGVYGYFPHEGGVLVTGDPSGRSGSAISGINKAGSKINAFMIIAEEFDLREDQIIGFPRRLLNHSASRDFCNEVFYRIPIYFDAEHCKELWQEIYKAKPKVTSAGKIELYKDRSTGYEMDRVDSMRYGFACVFKNLKNVRDVETLIKESNAAAYNTYKGYEWALKPSNIDTDVN